MHLIPLIMIIILARQNCHILNYEAMHNICQCLATFYSQKYDITVLFDGNIFGTILYIRINHKASMILLISVISLRFFCIKLMRCISQNIWTPKC